MRRVVLVVVAAAALALAGCLGGGGEAAETASTDETTPEETGSQASDEPDDEANATDEPSATWRNETREGSFTGAYAGAQAVDVAVFGNSESVTVADGTRNLTVHLTSETELEASVNPPCEDEGVAGTGLLDDCESHDLDTEDGSATWGTDDPEPGDWTVTIFRGENGAGEVSYSLTVARLLPG